MMRTKNMDENEMELRKGPWTPEEDTILANYITTHGEGHWNSVAHSAGLRRSGKSCRLRWLNYLRPDVRRGNITLEEQILILDLHSRWGNRWSKIAQHLPGRTDNEIKNYWRTRVIKQAKQLNCDVNSKQFRDALRYVWMPRLLERVQPAAQSLESLGPGPSPTGSEAMLPPHHSVSACGSSSASFSESLSSVEFHVPSISDNSEVSGHENGSDICPSFSEQGNGGGDYSFEQSLWNEEGIWLLQQQLCNDMEIKYNSLA